MCMRNPVKSVSCGRQDERKKPYILSGPRESGRRLGWMLSTCRQAKGNAILL